jgi:hypothetical protein
MISRIPISAGLVAMSLLAGCASAPPPPPPIVWIGGDPAHLVADQTACEKDSLNVDYNSAAGYSDPRYGPTNAMAAQINKDAPLADQHAAIRRAAMAACMTDKGWKPQD